MFLVPDRAFRLAVLMDLTVIIREYNGFSGCLYVYPVGCVRNLWERTRFLRRRNQEFLIDSVRLVLVVCG